MTQTITHRELRSESARIIDLVEAGQTIVITRNGTPVAELRPVEREREREFVPTAEIQRALSACPRVDYAAMRAEMDELFGEDRLGDDDISRT
jgi:prevent-host-death family protein